MDTLQKKRVMVRDQTSNMGPDSFPKPAQALVTAVLRNMGKQSGF